MATSVSPRYTGRYSLVAGIMRKMRFNLSIARASPGESGDAAHVKHEDCFESKQMSANRLSRVPSTMGYAGHTLAGRIAAKAYITPQPQMSVEKLHPDGSQCPEGTKKVPRFFKACCEDFALRTKACYHDIRYEWWTKHKGWFIQIAPSAGGGGIQIKYCPHCGTKL